MTDFDFNKIVTIWDPYMTTLAPLPYIRAYYKEVFQLDPSEFTLNTALTSTGVDSLEAFNLLYEIENTYQIRFDKNFLPITIGDLVNEMDKLIASK